MNIFNAIFSFLVAICIAFTNYMDYGTPTSKELELVKEDKLVFLDAAYSGQGVTTDGEYYYTSGSITAADMAGISKWDAETMELVAVNKKAIPERYHDYYDNNHIGGISYYNGKIYAAVENSSRDFPLIITYNTKNLKPVDVYKIDKELLPDGIPWCAVDGENGYLYCSGFKNVSKLLVFDLDTMEFSHYLELSSDLHRVQGGEVYNGVLYISYDVAGSNTEKIMAVDVKTGEVTTFAERTLPSAPGNEAEGMTVYPMADGSLYHVLDYDKSVGIYLRHYKEK